MDKSFNDEELSDIMKEIEALEEDFTAEDPGTASPVVEELAKMEEVHSVPVAKTETTNIVSLESKREVAPTSSAGSTTSMSFKVQGNLTLNLQFDVGGKVICLEVTETGLNIEMEGGVKFSVPVAEKSSIKKAV